MRLLILVLSVVFAVLFSLTCKATDSQFIKNLAMEQSKIVKEEMDELGPCKAMSGTLTSTCQMSKKINTETRPGSSKPITIDKIIYLSNFVKKSNKNDQISTLTSQ